MTFNPHTFTADYSDTYPTSPWTEAFQAASQQMTDQSDAAPMPQPRFDNDDVRPTHDALSDIYNRGY
jgi:hypothetical protein